MVRMHSDNVQLSFAIACADRHDLRQHLSKSLAAARFPFTTEILFEESNGRPAGRLRNQLYRRAKGMYVYFLDEDCSWPAHFPVAYLSVWMATGNAYGGPYLNGPKCTFFGRAYNFMTHTWLKKHAAAGRPVAVAGNVMIPKISVLTEPYGDDAAFGGEERQLLKRLGLAGVQLRYLEQMAVGHNAQHLITN